MSGTTDQIRVLHVDDDRGYLDVTATLLERDNDQLTVETASSPSEAHDLLADGLFDCIVSDYDMPGTSGIEFLEAVREEYPDLPFVLFTGKGSEAVAAEAFSAGATDYIQKSGETSQYTVLANRITNAVEKYRSDRESERANRRRRRTLEHIADGFAGLDSDLTVTDVNEQALGFTDLTREELIGTNYRDLMIDDAGEKFLDAYREVLETGEPQTVVGRSDVDPDRWIEERIFPVEDGDGIFAYFRDITERKQRERELDEQRQLYSTLVDQSPNGVMIVQDKEIQFVNDRLTTLTGYAETELLGRPFYELMTPEYRDVVQKRYEERVQGDQPPRNYETEIRTSAGERRVIDLHGSRSQYRGAPATLATFNDVTERKEREQTLSALHSAATEVGRAETEAQVYETLMATAERVLDFDLVAVDVEHEGYLIQEAWTLDINDGEYYERTSLADDDTFAVRAYNRQETVVVDDLQQTDITPASSSYRSVLTVPIGEYGTFQTVSTDVGAFDERDREFAELLVDHARVKLSQHRDEQALRERTAELERKNERLEEFASIISHDLRNPLNTLGLSLELVHDTDDEEHFQRCQRAIDRMEQLLENLLTLARQGRELEEREPVELGETVEAVWTTIDTEEGDLTVETRTTLSADRSRLKQLLANLIRNAIEHGEPPVSVTVGDLPDGFYVADDGPGIPASKRETVFDTGYSNAPEGTGLGLAIVEEIAEAHGWEVTVTESDQGGARFEFGGIDPV